MIEMLNTKRMMCLMLLLSLSTFVACSNTQNFQHNVEPTEYNLSLTEITIEIPGLADEDTYLFMADNQANFDDVREDLGWFGTSKERVFLDENGISAADNMDNWINYANNSNVDGMLMGGDIIDFYSEKNINVLYSKISELNVPYLYTYGNHDSYVPWENKFVDDNEDFLNLFMEGNSEIQIFDQGEYYIASIRNYQVDGTAQVSDEALETFKTIYEQNKPIILMCHVPIFTEQTDGLYEAATEVYGTAFKQYDAGEFGIVDESLLMGENCGYELTDSSKQFLELVLSEDSPVVAVLSGHLHKEWEGYITDDIYEYVGPGAFTNKGALIRIIGSSLNEEETNSKDEITVTGYWEDGYWVEDGVERERTVIESWCPDGIHPGNNYSERANEYLAQIHAKYLRELFGNPVKKALIN